MLMYIRHHILPLFCLIFLVGVAEVGAQVALDVKTPWGVKEKVRYVKQGVNSAIDAVDWARRTEFGEDYSLWLRSLDRSRTDEGVVVRLSYEIRTPAFLGHGDLIASDRVEISYDPALLDSLVNSPKGTIDREEWLASSMLIDQVISVAGEVIPFPNALLRTALLSVARSLNRAPTDGEILEGTLLGLKVVDRVGNRLKEIGR